MKHKHNRKYVSLIVAILVTYASLFMTFSYAQVNQDQPPAITDVAKNMNERFAGPNVEQSVAFLEGERRAMYAKRLEIADLMELKPNVDVADIGAGSGFFARVIAEKVAPAGRVYAVEISKPFVDHIAETAKTKGLENLTAVHGDPHSPKLAEDSVDVAVVMSAYHHFEYAVEMLAGIKKALRPNGIFFLIDAERIKGVSPEFTLKMLRAGKGTFTDEIINAGFELLGEVDDFEAHYVLKFRHRGQTKH
jgi:predicted methyltransferase